MTATLQEYLDNKYSAKKKELKELIINVWNQFTFRQIEGGELDLKEYSGLEKIEIVGSDLATPLTKIDISNCKELKILDLHDNELTLINFLLPIHKKIETLILYNNNIQPTDIAFFAKFTNLKRLGLGITYGVALQQKKRNRFFGSLISLKPLTHLEKIDISATDVDGGINNLDELKELPQKFIKSNDCYHHRAWKYLTIECSPYNYKIKPKCEVIYNILNTFDFSLKNWILKLKKKKEEEEKAKNT